MKRFLGIVALGFFLVLTIVPPVFCEQTAEKKEAFNPPLVLGIPGFLVPNVKLTQEEHFGNTKELLAKQGIPFKVIVYDSKEYPLNVKSARIASYDDYSVAFSRVGPGILKAIHEEQVKRLINHEPALKEVIIFMYSQGGVISYSFVRKLYYWKKQYQNWVKNYGEEWDILRKDPEFIYMAEAFRHYHDTYAILTQREKDIKSDKNLMLLLNDGLEDLNRRIDNLITYLYNPESKYPQVHPLESPFYPKRYVKFAELAKSVAETRGRNPDLFNFMMDYSIFEDVLGIDFRFFSSAASFFGSPQANAYYGLLKVIPIRGFINVSDSALAQIKDTQLGSSHHENKLEALARESQFGSFVLNDKNILFVMGVNGRKGDDLVEQPSAHLSQHTFMEFNLNRFQEGMSEPPQMLETGPTVELPDWPRMPLPIHHFASGSGKDRKYGAAYLEEGSPVYEAFMAFLKKDFNGVDEVRKHYNTHLSQFLVEFFVNDENGQTTPHSTPFFLVPLEALGGALKAVNIFKPKSPIQNIEKASGFHVDSTFFNSDADTYVWLGHVDPEIQNQAQAVTSHMVFEVDLPSFHKVKINVPVRVGSISFVKIIADKKTTQSS